MSATAERKANQGPQGPSAHDCFEADPPTCVSRAGARRPSK
jgi:hypothetical protein